MTAPSWSVTRTVPAVDVNAEDFIAECYSMHEAFALSLRPAKSSDALKDRLMSMVRNRQKN